MSDQFKYEDNGLSEEHIKQICRFLDKNYVKGEYQRMQRYIQFKIWHKREMDKRDYQLALKKNKGENLKKT